MSTTSDNNKPVPHVAFIDGADFKHWYQCLDHFKQADPDHDVNMIRKYFESPKYIEWPTRDKRGDRGYGCDKRP